MANALSETGQGALHRAEARRHQGQNMSDENGAAQIERSEMEELKGRLLVTETILAKLIWRGASDIGHARCLPAALDIGCTRCLPAALDIGHARCLSKWSAADQEEWIASFRRALERERATWRNAPPLSPAAMRQADQTLEELLFALREGETASTSCGRRS